MAKRTNYDLQKITHQTKDLVTRTPLTGGSELMLSGMKNDYFPTQFYGVGPKKGKKVPLLPPQFGQSESVHIKQSRIRVSCFVTRVTRRVPLVEQEILNMSNKTRANHRSRDRMVVGLITTYAISAYHH
jgi:hypothetical protein